MCGFNSVTLQCVSVGRRPNRIEGIHYVSSCKNANCLQVVEATPHCVWCGILASTPCHITFKYDSLRDLSVMITDFPLSHRHVFRVTTRGIEDSQKGMRCWFNYPGSQSMFSLPYLPNSWFCEKLMHFAAVSMAARHTAFIHTRSDLVVSNRWCLLWHFHFRTVGWCVYVAMEGWLNGWVSKIDEWTDLAAFGARICSKPDLWRVTWDYWNAHSLSGNRHGFVSC